MGFLVEVEKFFEPYWVDCYLPDLHVAFEADGPQHKNRRKDTVRDDRILARFNCPIIRVTSETLAKSEVECLRDIAIILLQYHWGRSVVERRVEAFENGWQDG